jgi:hypothetical protein
MLEHRTKTKEEKYGDFFWRAYRDPRTIQWMAGISIGLKTELEISSFI